MDFFYDGQIRRYVTQFMRIFIGFKYQAGDGTQKSVPVMYGDLTRQVASIIKDNSENKNHSLLGRKITINSPIYKNRIAILYKNKHDGSVTLLR